MKSLNQCEETINKGKGAPYERRCESAGWCVEDGLHYCLRHSPNRVVARQEARDKVFLEKTIVKLNGWLREARAVARRNYIDSKEKFLAINRRNLPAHCSGMPLRRVSQRELNVILEQGLVKTHEYVTDRGRGHTVTSRDYVWIDMSDNNVKLTP